MKLSKSSAERFQLALPAMIIGLYLIVEKNLKFILMMQIGWW